MSWLVSVCSSDISFPGGRKNTGTENKGGTENFLKDPSSVKIELLCAYFYSYANCVEASGNFVG